MNRKGSTEKVLPPMRLGFLLATSHEQDLALAVRLIRAALAKNHQVRLFLMHEGLRHARRPELVALLEAGAEGALCSTNALEQALEAAQDDEVDGLVFGSQLDHAALVRDCDRFISFA